MAKFIFKPELIDFGNEPCTKTVKFIHECPTIALLTKPSWIGDVVINYSAYVSGAPLSGTLVVTVNNDVAVSQYSGVIELQCGIETKYVPVIYSYDSTCVPLGQVIDNVFFLHRQDSWMTSNDRLPGISVAKRWLRDNVGALGKNVRMLEIAIEADGRVPLPGDFIDYRKLCTYSDDGYLYPLMVNKNINRSDSVVTDDDGLYVLDSNGFVIGAYGTSNRPSNDNPYTYYGVNIPTLGGRSHYNIKQGELSYNGVFKFDELNQCFWVVGVPTTHVILEYVSDPLLRDKLKLETGGLRVHKNYQEALGAYIYSEIVGVKALVPHIEKRRAQTEYRRAMSRAALKSVRIDELIQIVRGIV